MRLLLSHLLLAVALATGCLPTSDGRLIGVWQATATGVGGREFSKDFVEGLRAWRIEIRTDGTYKSVGLGDDITGKWTFDGKAIVLESRKSIKLELTDDGWLMPSEESLPFALFPRSPAATSVVGEWQALLDPKDDTTTPMALGITLGLRLVVADNQEFRIDVTERVAKERRTVARGTWKLEGEHLVLS